ncbi:hypothetical protein PR202_ga03323 [Eleusine coracana subsp. coracana]|uniref:Serine/threonine-protein phosphatase n=1 Tax=Eleusine coracana subsp. coracana TaxID=191504 RepID=A0AAV5BM37_ELECO|nr:hypothetical protein PR202_ga03323 [Eleusine coracana subsp. coracana]
MDPALLDDVIRRLLEVKNLKPGKNAQLSESEIKQLCAAAKEIFLQQPNLLELEAPIKICGDVHGQYSDLLRLFDYGGYPPQSNYLFLGDYVDRGKQSLETICLLLAYKVKYPENFFLLRGNHECASVNRIYVAALIDEKILCMHGGLSPELNKLDQILNLNRPTDVPDTGLLCDLLWLSKTDMSFSLIANVTIFSAPNYCGEFDNAGAMMSVDETLMCSFQILKPARKMLGGGTNTKSGFKFCIAAIMVHLATGIAESAEVLVLEQDNDTM